MKKTIAILLCLVMLVSCFAACGKAEETPAADNNAAAPEAGNEAAPEAGNEAAAEGEAEEAKRTDLKVQLNSEPATLDFHQDQSTARSYIGLNLFANLVTYDQDGSVIGEMAESWSHNDELTEWTFVIKQGAKFSDGSEITMDDVLYSFQRGKDLAYIPEYSQIESIEAISDTEIKFTLNAPNGLFANVLATDGFCGTLVWQYADIKSAKEINRARHFNNKGLVDEFRRPKMSYYMVKDLFKNIP